MSSTQPSHTDWSRTCLEQIVPLKAGKARAIALVRQWDDAGVWHPMVLLLTKDGQAMSGSDWLPIQFRGNGACLTLTDERQGLLAVTDREQRPNAPIFDVLRWFAVKWRGSKIRINEIGRWDDIHLGMHIRGVPTKDGSLWAGQCYPTSATKPVSFRETQLLLAQSSGLELPAPKLTDVESIDLSDLIPFGDEVYVLVTARFERIELWAIDARLNVRNVLQVERKRNKKETLGPARMARCGDALIMVWGRYHPRVGEKKPRTWQGTLHTASYHPDTQTVSETVAATSDTRVLAATLNAHPLSDSILVTWQSRPKRGGGGMRAVRFSSLDDLPRDPVALSEKYAPLFIMDESGPFLRPGQSPDNSAWAIPDKIPPL